MIFINCIDFRNSPIIRTFVDDMVFEEVMKRSKDICGDASDSIESDSDSSIGQGKKEKLPRLPKKTAGRKHK